MISPAQIFTIRSRLGLSRDAFATFLGVSTRTLYRYEAGDQDVSASVSAHIITLLRSPHLLLELLCAYNTAGSSTDCETDAR